MIDKSQLPNVKGEYRFDAKINNWFDLKGRAEILFRKMLRIYHIF